MSINNNISKFANTVDSSGQIDFADLANKPTTLAGYGITDGASGGSVTSYTNASDLPLSGNSAGDLAYVVETNRMYVNTGSGWYSISLVNTDPSITSVQDANSNTTPFTLSTDGTATVITITASDPEGVPVSYSYSVTSGSLTNGGGTTATVSQGTGANTNVFTITPTTTEDYAGSFTLTFTVSDGVNTSTSANAFSLQFSINNAKYTTLLLKADASSSDNQADASSNSLTITESGNVTSTAFSPYHPKGYSAYFDHTGDYLLHGDGSSSAYITLSGDFTIEAFIFSNGDFSSSQNNVFGSDLTHEGNYQVYVGSSYNLAIYDNSTAYLSTGTVPQDEWAHIAITRSGSTVTYWINGVSAGTSTVSTTLKYRIIGGLIQSSTSTVYNSFKGYISNARIVNGTAIYTSSFTPPTEALTNVTNTELLACHLPYLKDGSSNDYDITITGDVKLQQFGPFDHEGYTKSSYGGSIYMDGNGDELSLSPSASELVFGTDAYTVEFWINPSSTPSGNAHIYGANSTNGFLIYYTSSKIAVNKYSVSDVISYAETPPLNQWIHYAFVREGTGTNQTKIYKNGVVVATGTDATNWATNTNWTVGGNPASVQDVNGYLSDLRVVKGTAVYTSAFTPPTSPLTAITNTQLLTCTNKHEIWDAASGESITLNGNVDASTTQYKWGNSVAFDGAGDYLSITSSSDLLDFGTGDFTIEFWMYLNSYTTGDIVADARAVWNDQGWSFEQQNNGIMLYSSGGQRLTTSAINTSTAQWIHVAFARESGTLRSYINGANETSVTYSTAINTTASTIRIGQRQDNGGTQLDGYIEDFRITKGLARYTSTFTAPSSTFAG